MVYKSKLKPLRNLGSFDGEKSSLDMPRDIPLLKTCTHKEIKIVRNELRCKCGSAWAGREINELYKLLKR